VVGFYLAVRAEVDERLSAPTERSANQPTGRARPDRNMSEGTERCEEGGAVEERRQDPEEDQLGLERELGHPRD